MGQIKSEPRIAIVHDFMHVFSGGEKVVYALYEMYPKASIYMTYADPLLVKKYFPKADFHTSYLQNSRLRKIPGMSVLMVPKAIESFDLSRFDIVISSSGAFSHGVITGPQTKHITYCHTPIRYAWDWKDEYLKEKGWDKGLKGLIGKSIIHKLRNWDAAASSRTDVWVANSFDVQKRIQKYYRADSQVIHPPVDVDFYDYNLESEVKEEKFLISISRLTSYKRIDLMIEVAAKLKMKLVVAGRGDDLDRLKSLADKFKADVDFVGRIEDEEARRYLCKASAFIFASWDDFGIAPVEALACGCKDVAFEKGGTSDFIKDGVNGVFFSEQTADSLEDGIKRCLEIKSDRKTIRNTALGFSKQAFCSKIKKLVEV